MVRVMGRVTLSPKREPKGPPAEPVVTVRLPEPVGFRRTPRWQRGAARADRHARRYPVTVWP